MAEIPTIETDDQRTKEEYKHELERVKEEYRSLQKQKTAWMVAAILFMALFAITLALKLTH